MGRTHFIQASKLKYLKKDLGNYLRNRRRELKVTQARIAELLGMTQQAYSHKEDTGEFKFYELTIIFKELKTPKAEILKLTGCENE